ncbi:MAG: hypothetical protein BWY09_02175 [Candidatus Hydrogenedentes bacterium ADurb.Bin179]|nr:MAG: hypothetical protein BWY09_02175 [Candidatus Hydrogenedentes bacterium ADurb.Bin179]
MFRLGHGGLKQRMAVRQPVKTEVGHPLFRRAVREVRREEGNHRRVRSRRHEREEVVDPFPQIGTLLELMCLNGRGKPFEYRRGKLGNRPHERACGIHRKVAHGFHIDKRNIQGRAGNAES